jgi:hypothetical protein
MAVPDASGIFHKEIGEAIWKGPAMSINGYHSGLRSRAII